MSTQNTDSLRILIIDDSPDWQDLISVYASLLGHRPQTLGEHHAKLASQVETILRAAERDGDPFKIVTIDWQFGPLALGRMILVTIKKQFPYIACIIVSGTPDAAQNSLELRDEHDLDVFIPKTNKLNENTLAQAIKKGIERVQEREARQTKEKQKSQSNSETPSKNLEALHQNLIAYFSKDDLKNLCLYLNVDYENLEGDTKSSKARELIYRVKRENRLSALVEKCQVIRPSVSW